MANIPANINAHIKPNFKVCNAQTADNCIIAAPDDKLHWIGRSCYSCYQIERAAYYQTNKKAINDRVTAKRRTKRIKVKELAEKEKEKEIEI